MEIDIHFVRERVALGAVRVLHVPTSLQYGDIFTKGFPTAVLTFDLVSMFDHLPVETVGGY